MALPGLCRTLGGPDLGGQHSCVVFAPVEPRASQPAPVGLPWGLTRAFWGSPRTVDSLKKFMCFYLCIFFPFKRLENTFNCLQDLSTCCVWCPGFKPASVHLCPLPTGETSLNVSGMLCLCQVVTVSGVLSLRGVKTRQSLILASMHSPPAWR